MPTFNSVEQLHKYLKEQAKKALQTEVADRVKKLIEFYIQQELYETYEPTTYDRTYQLLRSVRVGQVVESGNTLEIEIYITPDLLGHYSIAGGSTYNYSPMENVRADQLMGWLEQGYYEWGGRPKTEIFPEVLKDLKREMTHVQGFIKYLKSQGIQVV